MSGINPHCSADRKVDRRVDIADGLLVPEASNNARLIAGKGGRCYLRCQCMVCSAVAVAAVAYEPWPNEQQHVIGVLVVRRACV